MKIQPLMAAYLRWGPGYEERQKPGTGYQDQILDHYRIYPPNTKKRILNGHSSRRRSGTRITAFRRGTPDSPGSLTTPQDEA